MVDRKILKEDILNMSNDELIEVMDWLEYLWGLPTWKFQQYYEDPNFPEHNPNLREMVEEELGNRGIVWKKAVPQYVTISDYEAECFDNNRDIQVLWGCW